MTFCEENAPAADKGFTAKQLPSIKDVRLPMWHRLLLPRTPGCFPPLSVLYKWPFAQNLASMKCHRDRSRCRLPHHKGRLSAKCNQIQSTAAVLRLEWHTNYFSLTRSESVPRPNPGFKKWWGLPPLLVKMATFHILKGVLKASDTPSGWQSRTDGSKNLCWVLWSNNLWHRHGK